ncbi:glycosyltransferase [Clavibacter sp. MX14-G9D]|uniref:glycosyltransferase n=1 Tax=Clavibacter sp. MX14-G9D TaxID=3064656 RepID=UPI0037BF3D3E
MGELKDSAVGSDALAVGLSGVRVDVVAVWPHLDACIASRDIQHCVQALQRSGAEVRLVTNVASTREWGPRFSEHGDSAVPDVCYAHLPEARNADASTFDLASSLAVSMMAAIRARSADVMVILAPGRLTLAASLLASRGRPLGVLTLSSLHMHDGRPTRAGRQRSLTAMLRRVALVGVPTARDGDLLLARGVDERSVQVLSRQRNDAPVDPDSHGDACGAPTLHMAWCPICTSASARESLRTATQLASKRDLGMSFRRVSHAQSNDQPQPGVGASERVPLWLTMRQGTCAQTSLGFRGSPQPLSASTHLTLVTDGGRLGRGHSGAEELLRVILESDEYAESTDEQQRVGPSSVTTVSALPTANQISRFVRAVIAVHG